MRRSVFSLALVAALAAGSHAGRATDWPMFGFGPRHAGHNPAETTITPANVSTLKPQWTFSLTQYQQAHGLPWKKHLIIAQPVVAGGVALAGGTADMVYVGDGNGLFVALRADSKNPAGELVWARSTLLVPTTCADVGRRAGIMSTAAIDRLANGGRGAVYLASNGAVYAWDLATGATLPGWPEGGFVIPNLSQDYDTFIYSGLTFINDTLYVTNAGKCDRPPYHGAITMIDTVGVYMKGQWFAASGSSAVPTLDGGGIWGPGGVSIDMTSPGGALYTATGNPIPDTSPTATLYTEAMVRLRPNLSAVDWAVQPANASGDQDFGSTPVPFHPVACPREMAAVLRKDGYLYITTTDPAAPGAMRFTTRRVARGTNASFNAVTFDDSTQLLLVASGTNGIPPLQHGLIAFKVSSRCIVQLAWQTNVGPDGGPIIALGTPLTNVTAANGLAFFGVGLGAPDGVTSNGIFAVAQVTGGGVTAGQALWHSSDIATGLVGAPVVVNGHVYAATGGTVHAYALPASP